MAKITDLLAVDAITGDEFLPIVQGGATKRATMSALRALIVPFLQYWYKGDKGEPGAAGNVAATLAQLRNAAIANASMIAAYDGSGSTMTWTPGDFTGQADDFIVVRSDVAPLTAGAWVRQGDDGVAFQQAGAGAIRRRARAKARELVSVMDFGAMGDGVTDDTAAFDAAIATGKRVRVPYTPDGYLVSGIKVVSDMEVVGEKAGKSRGPMLIVKDTGASAFYNATGDNVFHCVFENLACRPAIGVTNASFYGQSTRTFYSAYFTFRRIETYKSLRFGYRGLFIFALWDRCRDGYLGVASDIEHTAILALAENYGQTNQQNINCVRDSMIFGSYGGQGAVVASYGVLWVLDNTDFEAINTPAFTGYNVFQVHFKDVWFEGVSTALAVVNLLNYPGTNAASGAVFDHCNFVFNGATQPSLAANVESPGTAGFRNCFFNLVPAGTRLANDGARITFNDGNVVGASPGAATFMLGMHADTYADGRRCLNGAIDNGLPAFTLQNEGAISASKGFMSDDNIVVGTDFVTIATSLTGLGGMCIVSGYDPVGGGQLRFNQEWQGPVCQTIGSPFNGAGKTPTFRVVGDDLQMKVDTGSVVIFTTLLN